MTADQEKIELLRSLNRVLERALQLASEDASVEEGAARALAGMPGRVPSPEERFEGYLREAALAVEETIPEVEGGHVVDPTTVEA